MAAAPAAAAIPVAAPAVKDVEALLLKERKHRRRPGDVPYPVGHSMQLSNYDIWDHMFYSSCCRRSLSMHQFETPPVLVLDLGCGGGYWALEAAKEWTSSTIIGFDLRDIQPRLFEVATHKDLARRVKWMHGNLLDGLPFPPDHFDFVRIARIGLGVPEDEWQYVLEEVARVMKPGAPLEILEEDLIFPCSEPIRQKSPPRSRPSLTVDLPMSPDSIRTSLYSGRPSTTLMSESWHISFDDGPELGMTELGMKPMVGLPTLQESPPSSFTHSVYPSQYTLHSPSAYTASTYGTISTLISPMSSEDHHHHIEAESHPQDHTKLKIAWEAMLSRRFLSSQLLSVLPFYLSSCFTDVQSHPTLEIPLPPNSANAYLTHSTNGNGHYHDSHQFDLDSQFVMKTASARRSNDTDNASLRHSILPRNAAPYWATMHLAKVVETIVGCKESIWAEYQLLNTPDLPPVVRTVRPKDIRAFSRQSSVREDFDSAWSNWHNDMMDRINMRHSVSAQLGWPEPAGERPDWRIWRDNVDIKPADEPPPQDPANSGTGPNLCRAMKGFVAWKPR
ncbi:hypothetical protein BDZ89DRAFT_1005460 [Hymenopellis radicata]|nr:hypothetical protein BDZ89DRAFT_1005460 [Hymenopellis radicata]